MKTKYNTNKTHPRERANFLLKFFFCWELPFVFKAYNTALTESDLYEPLKCHKSSTISNKLEKMWNKETETNKNPSLWKVLIKTFGLEFLVYGLILLPLELIIQISKPVLIGKLMDYFTPNQTTITKTEAYVDSTLLAIVSLLWVVIYHHVIFGVYHLGMKVQTAVAGLIYRKSLKLSYKSLSNIGGGHILNLLANDIARFEYFFLELHYVWLTPLQMLVIFGIINKMLGPSGVTGIGVVILFILVQIYLTKKISTCRMKTALKTDERINLMSEILAGIKTIKMFSWEKAFSKLVEKSRKLEMKEIKTKSYFKSIIKSGAVFTGRTAIFFCILVYVLRGGKLNPKYVYVLSSFYETIRLSAVAFLPHALMMLGETVTSVKRLKEFLTQPETISDQNVSNIGIKMKAIQAKWDLGSDNILTDINLEVSNQKFISIIGPVGSGKTTLLLVILKELKILQGTLEVGGRISYASQEPWLFSDTVRENIVFGEKFDKIKYEEVIQACALEHDFNKFPFGDLSLVGERGIMLSGGQKARIGLARTVYQDADIYLLDDPLSAVDVNVGKQLFENCFRKYLCNKTRILVTHQLQFLKSVDVIYLLENRVIAQKGTYQELTAINHSFLKLLENSKEKFNKIDEKKLIDCNAKQIEDEENQMEENISNQVYLNFFKFGGIWSGILVIFLYAIIQVLGIGGDYFLSFWVDHEQKNIHYMSTYDFLYIYTGFVFLLIFFSIGGSIQFFSYCINNSIHFYSKMYISVVKSPMRFFCINSLGRILNRFSKDIGLIDEYLPETMIDVIEIPLNIFGVTIIVVIMNPWICIPSIVVFVVIYYIRKLFLTSTRSLKRIEAIARSRVYSQVSSSTQGLSTIRALKAQNHLQTQFDNYQDRHSSAYYMFLTCNEAFGFWLDITCVIYTIIIIFSFLFLDSEFSGATVGLCITQSLTITGLLQWGMKQASCLENQMVSVERVSEYTQLKPETNLGTGTVPTDWPLNGRIVFENVSLRYSLEDPYVLKNISLVINPKEKIGIVGRTGAGKSSLVSVFFRLAHLDGNVCIDNININDIPLDDLRSKITIIPQEPTLFSGTIRYNLDPFMEYLDSDLWNALEEVELKTVVSNLPKGLSNIVNKNGNNFSIGQKQLFCLARAILCKNKILILDEATANVDPLTDKLIQKTIHIKFKNSTVLTIAHRVNTVLDCDRILVLEDGNIVEFDKPSKLLENINGVFYCLANKYR